MFVKSVLSSELSISTGRARVCEVIKITVLFYFLEVLKWSWIAEASNICKVFPSMKENITVYYANAVIMPQWKTSNFLWRSTGTSANSDRIRGNDFNLKEGRFQLDVRGKSFTERAVRFWQRLPGEVVAAPSLEVLKTSLGGGAGQPELVLDLEVQTCTHKRVGTWWFFRSVPTQGILWFSAAL